MTKYEKAMLVIAIIGLIIDALNLFKFFLQGKNKAYPTGKSLSRLFTKTQRGKPQCRGFPLSLIYHKSSFCQSFIKVFRLHSPPQNKNPPQRRNASRGKCRVWIYLFHPFLNPTQIYRLQQSLQENYTTGFALCVQTTQPAPCQLPDKERAVCVVTRIWDC